MFFNLVPMLLTFDQLESSLLKVMIPVTGYHDLIFDYFTNLYYIGCRPTELMNVEKWQRLDSQYFKLIPSKNNYPRFIKESAMTSALVSAIDSGSSSPYGYKYFKQLYFFEKWYEFQPCHVGKKSIDLYLFRHHYVKKLYKDGQSIPEITSQMGWVNPLMAENYIFSQIYSP